MERTIVIYETSNGKSPFLNWLNGLKDIKARATLEHGSIVCGSETWEMQKVSVMEYMSCASQLVPDTESISAKMV